MESYPDIGEGKNIFQYKEISADTFLGNSIILYGESKTGKSFVTNHLLKAISKKVLFLMVVSQTAYQDKSFPITNYTETPLIYEDLDMDAIRRFRSMCKHRSETKIEARKLENLRKGAKVLRKVFENIPLEMAKLNKILAAVRRIKKKELDCADCKDEKDEAENKMVKLYVYLMKIGLIYIRKNNIDISEYGSDVMSILFANFQESNPPSQRSSDYYEVRTKTMDKSPSCFHWY